MALKACENCSKSFEGEEKQIFCSSTCKQQAYRKRKTERQEDLFEMKFSLKEFESLIQTPVGQQLKNNFILYCFMRKNLPQVISFENLILYFENNIEEFIFITNSAERGKPLNSYESFYEKYMAGEITVVEDYYKAGLFAAGVTTQ